MITMVTVLGLTFAFSAQAIPISFTKLSDFTGGSPAATAVYRADLSGVGFDNLASITITDNSSGLGGATGQFSGFDLDAIILSYDDCATAGCVAALGGLPVFDYSPAGTLFTPGTQRAPTDAKLFGTDVSGLNIDNLVATLGSFDANSTTSVPPAFGFVSMGDNGVVSFNLSSIAATAGLNLYIGEVGDNGEVAAGSIEVFDSPVQVPVPEPGMFALFGLGLVVLGLRRRHVRL